MIFPAGGLQNRTGLLLASEERAAAAENLIAIDLNGELWFSDGAESGTQSAGFISGAYGDGIFYNEVPTFAVLNGELYFAGCYNTESFGPTARPLPHEHVAQEGQNWTPIGGQI